jgi:hypothetical protein
MTQETSGSRTWVLYPKHPKQPAQTSVKVAISNPKYRPTISDMRGPTRNSGGERTWSPVAKPDVGLKNLNSLFANT